MKRRLAESFAIGNYSVSMSRPPMRKLNNVERMGLVSAVERIPVGVKTPNEFDKTRRQLRTAQKRYRATSTSRPWRLGQVTQNPTFRELHSVDSPTYPAKLIVSRTPRPCSGPHERESSSFRPWIRAFDLNRQQCRIALSSRSGCDHRPGLRQW
jgi:hypothetical protein